MAEVLERENTEPMRRGDLVVKTETQGGPATKTPGKNEAAPRERVERGWEERMRDRILTPK